MHIRSMIPLLAAACLCVNAPAWAASGMVAPLAGHWSHETPYGQGKYYWGIIHVYDAALWTDAAQWSYDAPFALALRYEIDATPQAIREETVKQLKRVSALTPEQLARFGTELNALYPEMKDGDTITASYEPGDHLTLYHNGTLRGTVSDPAFVRPFFDIWLSPRTSEPALRAKLLGQ